MDSALVEMPMVRLPVLVAAGVLGAEGSLCSGVELVLLFSAGSSLLHPTMHPSIMTAARKPANNFLFIFRTSILFDFMSAREFSLKHATNYLLSTHIICLIAD